MTESEWLADRFEAHRPRLRAMAHRLLGSGGDAEDAVQEAWLRLSRVDAAGIDNQGGWLTTVVARVSLDMLRSRRARPQDPADRPVPDEVEPDPEHEAMLADAVGAALVVVLDTLSPAERLAFVLHDMFAVPFDAIGAVVGRSPDAAKQLASRARRKVRGSGPGPEVDPARQREVVDAFLAASRGGDFDALVALLHPDVRLDADAAAVRMGSPEAVRGARSVAAIFSGRAQGARPALVDGAVGVVWAVRDRPKVVWDVTVAGGRIVHLDMLAAPDTLDRLDLTILAG